jgi:Ca-activated chloride channel family protein
MRTPITLLLAALAALAVQLPPRSAGKAADVSRAHSTETRAHPSLLIAGQVVDSVTGRPLQEVVVRIDGVEGGAVTGRLGRYVLRVPASRVAADELTLRAVYIGYGEAVRTVRPADQVDGVLVADFRLAARGVGLEGGVASETRVGARPAGVRPPRGIVVAEADAAAPLRRMSAIAAAGSGSYAPTGWLPDPGYDREQYARIVENGFRSAVDAPLSTFSVDVDRASYSNIRRFLMRENRLPPIDAVQIEEMVNYFPYRYELPRGDAPVAVTTEVGTAPWADGHRLLRVGVASRPVATEDLPPANLVFLIDVSGSMQAQDKLPLVKRSLRLLVDELRPQDRLAMVVYAGAAGLVLEPTSGADKSTILAALDRLEAGGATAGGQGLRLAYDVARRSFREEGNNRVILATDGDFNVGESSDAAMTRLVEARREEGTFLTILGFGTGNLQATKMQEMAQNGNGNYAYIDGVREARKVLVGEMGGTILTMAKDVKVQVEFNPARVRAYRLLGYENRLLAEEDFNDDAKDAGEVGAGHTVTALYEVVPVGSPSEVFGGNVDPLRYRTPEPIERSAATDELAFVKVRYKEPTGRESRLLATPVNSMDDGGPSDDLRFASAVAGFGMLLRNSEHRGSLHAGQVVDLAESAIGPDPEGYRREFLEMVQMFRLLTDGTSPEGGAR